MARKDQVSYDATHGLYHRSLGMDRNGRKPKFWLGADRGEAERRAECLELLWRQVESDWKNLLNEYPNWLETKIVRKPDRPLWDELTLAVAKTVAKGGLAFPVPRNPRWSPYKYTARITGLQRRFTVVHFVPADEDLEHYEIGAEDLRIEAQKSIREGQDKLALLAGQAGGQTWHQALDAYTGHLEKLPDLSGWYWTQIKQVRRLKENHADLSLAQLGLNKIEEMIDFWRHRPTIKCKVIATSTARNQIIQLNMVLKWLHRNEQFAWRKPDGIEDLKQAVKDRDEDRRHLETFTVEELTVLWKCASPLVRLEMLLALNCGFKYAEIASLALGEIRLNVPYPGIVRVGRPAGLGSWITRYRRKTKVYGEWKLWPHTVAGVEWALASRKAPITNPTDYLLVTRSGRPLDAPTKGKNKSDKIYSSWQHLYRTVRAEQGEVRYLPFKYLEKTAADWIRAKYGGEAANLFTSHGKPVKSDHLLEVYSSKPFARLFEALDALAGYLLPMFESVPEPWKKQSVPLEKLEQIRSLRKQGETYQRIAEAVGLHWVTVGKYCRAEKRFIRLKRT